MNRIRITLLLLFTLLLASIGGGAAQAQPEQELIDSASQRLPARGYVTVSGDGIELVTMTRQAGTLTVELYRNEDGYSAVIDAPPTTANEPFRSYIKFEGVAFERLQSGDLKVRYGKVEIPHCGHLRIEADPDPCIFGVSGDSARYSFEFKGSRGGTFNFESAPSFCPSMQIPRPGFDDTVNTVHEPAINCLVWLGLANGIDATHFAPDRNLTRGQMSAFLYRFLQKTEVALPGGRAPSFSDVGPNTTHREAIHQLALMGIVNGRNDGSFQPGAPITRAQTATMTVNVLEYVIGNDLPLGKRIFDDVGGVHADSIRKAAEAGMMDATSSTRFSPGRDTTRGEMASALARMLDVLLEHGVLTPSR